MSTRLQSCLAADWLMMTTNGALQHGAALPLAHLYQAVRMEDVVAEHLSLAQWPVEEGKTKLKLDIYIYIILYIAYNTYIYIYINYIYNIYCYIIYIY